MNIELERGTALVINGPQGSGKSLLARSIAGNYGTFVEIDGYKLDDSKEIDSAILSGAATIICDDGPCSKATATRLKSIITAETVTVNRKHQEPVRVKTPYFIFCTSGMENYMHEPDRHFRVINVGRDKSIAA